MKEISPIERAVRVVGSQSALARILACTPQHVQKMCASGHVPAIRVLKIESATGISRNLLRPDLYPDHSATLDQTIPSCAHLGESDEHAGFLSSAARASP